MGKVKTEHIKNLAKELLNRFPERFSGIFDENKKMVDELTEGTTTRVRNKVAGYITRRVSSTLSSYSDEELDEESIV